MNGTGPAAPAAPGASFTCNLTAPAAEPFCQESSHDPFSGLTLTGALYYGASFTIGRTQNESIYWSLSVGIGLGASVRFSPFSQESVSYTGADEVSLGLTGMAQIGDGQIVELGASLDAGVSAFALDGSSTYVGTSITGSMGNVFLGEASGTASGGIQLTAETAKEHIRPQWNPWGVQAGAVAFAGIKFSRSPGDKKTEVTIGKMEVLELGAKLPPSVPGSHSRPK